MVRIETGGEDAAHMLARYRTLCERLGVARASHARLPEAAQDELSELEERLLALLSRDVEPAASPAAETAPAPRSQTVDRPAGPTAAVVYTDGSAEGNPGPGGFCALVRIPGRPDRELSGGTAHTTNNKMELTAAIAGLRAALDAGASEATVVTDSEYLVKGMRDWLPGWERKGWKTATGQPVKNRELWEQLAVLVKGRAVRWQWVRGHAGHPENERCDLVATTRAREAARQG